MSSSKADLADRFAELVEQIFVHMRSTSPPDEWSDLELTMPQIRVLVLLTHEPRRMSDIAEALRAGLPSATSMVDRLVSKGLVERVHDPHDRRLVLCQLTDRGHEEIRRFWRIRRSKIEALVEALAVDELRTVVNAMEILTAALKRRSGPGAQAPPGCQATDMGA